MNALTAAFQYVIPLFLIFTIAYGYAKGVSVYDSFVTGAKDGIEIILGIFPYVLAIFLMVKTLSNAATLSIFTEILKTTGPDSQASLMSAVIMGSAETTFYVIAVYLGAAGIKKAKYLVPVCLTADAVGVIIAIIVVRLMFSG
jgi:spore maturation protein B